MSARLTLSVEEAAELLGVARGTAYEAARNGDLPTVRVGRRILVPRARLLALLGEDVAPESARGGEDKEEANGPARPTSASARGDVTLALKP